MGAHLVPGLWRRKKPRHEEAALSENKTKGTDASVESYLSAIDDPSRRQDCVELSQLMARVTQEKPRMWGSSIVGFGSYHYRYESGREGDSCLAGYSSRKGDISIYLMGTFEGRDALLAQLGKHKMGKACLTIRRLQDVDTQVLEQLVAGSVTEVRARYP